MAAISVKDRLDSIGFTGRMPTDALSYPRSPLIPANIRGSLRFALAGTESFGWPGIYEVHQGWSSKEYHDDDDKWLEDHQGLVFNGKYWFCSQRGHGEDTAGTIRRCKDSTVDLPRIGKTLGSVSVPGNLKKYYTHLGEIDWARVHAFEGFVPGLAIPSGGAEGLVLAAMETDVTKYWCGTVLAFWDDMAGLCPEASSPLLYPAAFLGGPPDVDFVGPPDVQLKTSYAQCGCPWVALNPWDGLLYSAPFDPKLGPNGGILLHVYDVNNRIPLSKAWAMDEDILKDQLRIPEALFDELDTDGDGVIWVFKFLRSVELGASLKNIQGGCFSNDGCLYLVNDVHNNSDVPDKHGVWRFSMLSGALLDVIGVDREGSDQQECEGVCLYGAKAAYAVPQLGAGETFVCATVWEWEAGTPDFVWLKRMKLGPFVT